MAFAHNGFSSAVRAAKTARMVTCVWNIAAELGEGALWSPEEAALWFVDILGRRIHRFDPASGTGQSWDAPSPPGFILRRDSGFIVGLEKGLHRFDPASGSFTLLQAVEEDRPQNRLNDGTVGPDRAIWFGSKVELEDDTSGAWYRWSGNGPAQRFDDGYVVTNGPAFSPDGGTLYHSDSGNRLILARNVAADGTPGENRVFAQIADGDGYPDGLAMDREGCLWVALWAGGAVRRYSPAGEVLQQIAVPARNVTKPAFGGADGRTLYLTTAACGLDADVLAAEPGNGGLFAVRVDVGGDPAPAFPG